MLRGEQARLVSGLRDHLHELDLHVHAHRNRKYVAVDHGADALMAADEPFAFKLGKAVNLEELKKQREQAQIFVAQLEKQLPGKAEMSALLSDINQAGLGRSLQFELFRPGQVVVRQYYAELPIAIRVTGNYHDIGDFTSDIAHLSRIVTLDNMSIAPRAPGKDGGIGNLTMDVTARTFRYLDTEEIAAQAALAKPAGAAK